MPRKKSGKNAARAFKSKLGRIEAFVSEIESGEVSDQAVTWAYEAAIIKTAVAFEHLMLACIVTAINNDTSTISLRTGIAFPRHLTDKICEYLVTGGGFFDYSGRSGLIKKIKGYVPNGHWLLVAVKKNEHTKPLEQLVVLRNFAAHESPASKRKALEALGMSKVGSAGSWAKRQGRFRDLLTALTSLADDIEAAAPY